MVHAITAKWDSKVAFNHQVVNHIVRTDSTPPDGEDSGASPKRLLLVALAGCTGIDVVMILDKMKVPYEGIEIEVSADLTDEHPKVYSEIRVDFKFYGTDLNLKKIEKAVALSQDKYCGVAAMLRKSCPVIASVELLPSVA